MALICWLAQLIPDLPPHLPPSQLKEEVRQAKSAATGLRAQMEETEQKALLLERQLKEQGAKCRELEDQRTLTQSQEQRVAQSHREAQQSQAELASLEAILALLHLREVESNIYLHTITLLFVLPCHIFVKSLTVFDLRDVTLSLYLFAQTLFLNHSKCSKQVAIFITDHAQGE